MPRKLTNGRCRLIVNDWLVRLGQREISTELSREDFARELRAMIEPWRPNASFPGREEAAAYVRGIAKATGLLPKSTAKTERSEVPREKEPPASVQARRRAKLRAKQEAVRARKREASRKRVLKQIAKADREIENLMKARRAERSTPCLTKT